MKRTAPGTANHDEKNARRREKRIRRSSETAAMSNSNAVAYVYCRVSLDRLESVSIAAQESALRAYAAHRLPGMKLIILKDNGVSGGTRLYKRPAGQQLKEMQPGDQLLVTKVDRAFRSMADGATIIDELTRRSIGVHCLDVQVDTTTPTGRAMIHMLMVFAQLERERISERLREAAAYRRANGEVMHVDCNPPIGWTIERRKDGSRVYSADHTARRRCRYVFRLHEQGYSLGKIQKLCLKRRKRNHRDGTWCRSTLYRAINAARQGFPTTSTRRDAKKKGQ